MRKQSEQIKEVHYVGSVVDYNKCPQDELPEYAFIGRSNVGKSSLINMLTNSKKLAMVSAQPGKTKSINHFLVNKRWYLVDLPGYGWAKISREDRIRWEKMVKDYLRLRPNLACIFLLIDARLDPQNNDLEFIQWLGEQGLPFVLVFTKADKLPVTKSGMIIEKYTEVLSASWEELPPMILTSAEKGIGKEEILALIDGANRNYAQ